MHTSAEKEAIIKLKTISGTGFVFLIVFTVYEFMSQYFG